MFSESLLEAANSTHRWTPPGRSARAIPASARSGRAWSWPARRGRRVLGTAELLFCVAGPARHLAGFVGDALVCRVAGEAGCKLVMKAGNFVLGASEYGSRCRGLLAQRCGVIGQPGELTWQSARIQFTACHPPGEVCGLSGRARLRTHQRGLGAEHAVPAGVHHICRPLNRLIGTLARTLPSDTEFSFALLSPRSEFLLRLASVGPVFSFVGFEFAFVSQPVTLVGFALALVGQLVALVGLGSSAVRRRSVRRGRGLPRSVHTSRMHHQGARGGPLRAGVPVTRSWVAPEAVRID
jgi:hypothetical protein